MLAMAYQWTRPLADSRRASRTDYVEASAEGRAHLPGLQNICRQIPCPSPNLDENGSVVATTQQGCSSEKSGGSFRRGRERVRPRLESRPPPGARADKYK